MKKLIKIESTQPKQQISISWAVSNLCNFECRYCYPGYNDGDFKSPKDVDTIVKNLTHIIDKYRAIGKTVFDLSILGGEPTVWGKFGQFLEKIKSVDGVYITIITNGSRTLRWWNDYGDYVDNLTLSYHVAQADLDHSIAVADLMYAKGKKVTVHVLMDTDCWDKGIHDIEYMKKNSKYPWMIETKPVIYQDVNYTAEQTDFLKTGLKRKPTFGWLLKNFKMLLNGTVRWTRSIGTFDDGSTVKAKPATYLLSNYTNFTGWSCNIGLERIYIDYTGFIKGSCGQELFDNYNILDADFTETFNPVLGPTVCKTQSCTCSPEMHVSKFDLGQGNVSRARTVIPITDDRVFRNIKSSRVDIT